MKVAKKTAEYTVFLRKDKRYAVRSANRTWINGDDKVAILQKEGLMKAPEPKKAEEPVAEENTEAESAEATEVTSEEEQSE